MVFGAATCTQISSIVILERFSGTTLQEWKRLAELNAYDQIDSSGVAIERPQTLVQLSDGIIFEAIWKSMNIEAKTMEFELVNFVYGDLLKVRNFIGDYSRIKETLRYIVVESLGAGGYLSKRQ